MYGLDCTASRAAAAAQRRQRPRAGSLPATAASLSALREVEAQAAADGEHRAAEARPHHHALVEQREDEEGGGDRGAELEEERGEGGGGVVGEEVRPQRLVRALEHRTACAGR